MTGMRKISDLLKKMIVLLSASLAGVMLFASPSSAQDSSDAQLLTIIAENTTNILNTISGLPSYLTDAHKLVMSMLTTADQASQSGDQPSSSAASIGAMQLNFVNLANAIISNGNSQNTNMATLQNTLLGTDGAALPNANDLSYSTLLGNLLYTDARKPAEDSALNYIKNAGALTIKHPLPAPTWQGSDENIKKYVSYYNTVTSVESYNAYILGALYAESQSGGALSNAQTALLKQANDPAWFTAVGAEDLGLVLRQLLLYQSQMYVMLGQLLDTQKKMLVAQAMTNSLLIANNNVNENAMIVSASRKS
jgi:hypothetical protein